MKFSSQRMVRKSSILFRLGLKAVLGIFLIGLSMYGVGKHAKAFATNPTYEYTKVIGNSDTGGYSWGNSVTTDSFGNIYVTGGFSGTVDFDPSAGIDEHTAVGGTDIYVTKLSSDGSYVWTKTMGGSGYYDLDYGNSITIDTSGSVYVIGHFAGTIDFDPSAGIDEHTAAGGVDIYVTKLSSDGSYVWTKTMGGSSSDIGNSITIDTSDNVYVTGRFSGTVDFDPSAGIDEHTAAGGVDIYVTKLSSDGSYVWTKTMGGSSSGYGYGYSITIDTSGIVYVTGYFAGTIDFDPSAGIDEHTAAGGTDIYVTKLSSDGSYVWTKTMGGSSSDYVNSITTDTSGNVYVTGYFYGSADFDPSAGTDEHTAAGGTDIYVTKLNSDGSYSWTKTMGGSSVDAGNSITIDTSGSVYITGRFGGTVDFDPSAGEDTIAANSEWDRSLFVTSLDSEGSYLWTKTASGGIETDGRGITTDVNNNFYVTGVLYGAVDFDPQGSHDWQTASDDGATILMKLSLVDNPPSISLTPLTTDPTTNVIPTLTGTATDSEGLVLTVEYQMDTKTGTWKSCTAVDGTFDEASEEFSCKVSPALSNGTHTIYIRATDSENNTTESGSEASDTFTVNSTVSPPTVLTVTHIGETKVVDGVTAYSFITGKNLTIKGTTSPYATVVLTIHSDPYTCTTTADGEGNFSCTFTDEIPEGQHTLTVEAYFEGSSSITTVPITLGINIGLLAGTGDSILGILIFFILLLTLSLVGAMSYRKELLNTQ